MKAGTQIIYVPLHAKGDIHHGDCQAGFVTSVKGDVAYCRYWSKYSLGELRNKACSERCDISRLVVQNTVDQRIIDEMLPELREQARQAERDVMNALGSG